MKILITGGNGFLGRALAVALQERGDSVSVLALPTENVTWLERHAVRIFRGDVRGPESLVGPMRAVEGVFHLAAMIGVPRSMRDYYEVNVTGTENVCRAALAAGVHRIVHVSSAMVYNMAAGRAATEDDPLAPLNEPYCVSKARADQLVQRMIAEDHLPAVVIRPGTLYGPGDRLNFGRIADRVRARRAAIIGPGDNTVPFVHVTDVVRGLLLAMYHERAPGEVYNIAGDEPFSQQELLSCIAYEIGAPPPRLHVPYHLLYAAAWGAERIAGLSGYRIPPLISRHGVKLYGADNRVSIEKARRELGYAPEVPLRAGLKSAAAWYLRQASGRTGTRQPTLTRR